VVGLLLKGHLGQLSEQQTDAVQNCSESIRYMEELISDIVESSRLDYDGVSFDIAPVDLTLLVGSLVRRLRYHMEEHGVRMRVEPLPVVKGDEKALQKVFMNLIGNAINYRDPDKAQKTVSVRSEDAGDHWVIRVEDNGIGIPPDSLTTIWQKFVRGSNTSGVSGTGLGLYIVQQTIRGHGGDISVDSEVGVGTTFSIVLPKEPTPPEHSPVA
jgi:signal transduction histidine kinase